MSPKRTAAQTRHARQDGIAEDGAEQLRILHDMEDRHRQRHGQDDGVAS